MGRFYLDRYPWSCVGAAILLGILGVAVFSDWRPGALVVVVVMPLMLWIWKPNGIGQASVEKAENTGRDDA